MQHIIALNSKYDAVIIDIPPALINQQPATKGVNHVLVIDCSGSMYGSLPQLRQHLKTRVAHTLGENDTISIIWFSGRGEFGVLLEEVAVPGLKELNSVHKAIDRWLQPTGLTGFVEPIRELNKLAKKLAVNGKAVNAFFLSDGGENCWSRAEVIKAIADGAPLASITVVEYGYYADRAFLAQMAAKWGGSHIFARDFTAYEPVIEAAITRTIVTGAWVDVDVPAAAEGGIAVAINQGEVVAYSVEHGKVAAPPGTSQVAVIVPAGGKAAPLAPLPMNTDILYGLAAAFAPRVRSDIIWPILSRLGDVHLIKAFSNCFGKQAFSNFTDIATKAAVDRTKQFADGQDHNLVPVEDAYTILDLLNDLSDSNARVDFDHPDFSYAKIGRTRVDANTRLTADEQAEMDKLSAELKTTKDIAKLKDVQARINELTSKPEPLKFIADEKGVIDRGYEMSNLTTNSERPNISFLVRRPGTVDLTDRLASRPELAAKIPAKFPTYTYRNYTVIADGIVNIKKLPVVNIDRKMESNLTALVRTGKLNPNAYTIKTDHGLTTWVFDLSLIPIINQSMVKLTSAKAFFQRAWDDLKTQARLKVIKDAYNDLFDKKSEGFSALYGEDGGAWLSDQGIVSYSGFSPRSLQTESTDFYVAKELKVKIKGYSTLPSVNALRKSIAENKKLNGPSMLMKPTLDEVDAKVADKETFKAWAEEEIKKLTTHTRRLKFHTSKDVYSIIVGQTWFHEFATLDDNSMDLVIDGISLNFKAELAEVNTKI